MLVLSANSIRLGVLARAIETRQRRRNQPGSVAADEWIRHASAAGKLANVVIDSAKLNTNAARGRGRSHAEMSEEQRQ